MLKSIKISEDSLPRYPKHTVKALTNKIFTFEENRINIICGHNGVGKSTLLKQIKKAYGLNSFQFTTLKYEETKDILNRDEEQVLIDCDMFYHNKSEIKKERISSIEMLSNINSHLCSCGEHKMQCQQVLLEFIESLNWKNKTFEGGRKPILVFDEPTLSMSSDVERQFFLYFERWAQAGFQIIISSNAITHLDLDFNFIELEEGWVKHQKKFIQKLAKLYKEEK